MWGLHSTRSPSKCYTFAMKLSCTRHGLVNNTSKPLTPCIVGLLIIKTDNHRGNHPVSLLCLGQVTQPRTPRDVRTSGQGPFHSLCWVPKCQEPEKVEGLKDEDNLPFSFGGFIKKWPWGRALDPLFYSGVISPQFYNVIFQTFSTPLYYVLLQRAEEYTSDSNLPYLFSSSRKMSK